VPKEAAVDYRQKLLSLYELLPFKEHPFWVGVIRHELSLEQIIQGERQHYVRTKAGQALRRNAVEHHPSGTGRIFEAALENYLEEVVPDQSRPSHLDLIRNLLVSAGLTIEELDHTQPTPGNAAAMALYREISGRGSACHLIGAGVVEYYYAQLAPEIYEAYTGYYGMSPEQAKTYGIHGVEDVKHSTRALEALDEAVSSVGWPLIKTSVRDALVATSLHYDGMLQAALGRIIYWDGGMK
jgi:pyrroloquinoline quinone (PQQ) biosynthesis protein C